MSQFNYRLLIRMFQSRKLKNIVKKIHDKSLGLTNKDNHSASRELPRENPSILWLFIREIYVSLL